MQSSELLMQILTAQSTTELWARKDLARAGELAYDLRGDYANAQSFADVWDACHSILTDRIMFRTGSGEIIYNEWGGEKWSLRKADSITETATKILARLNSAVTLVQP